MRGPTSEEHTPTTGLAVVELTAPLGSFDFSTADEWHVVLLYEGTPVARVDVPSPGAVDSAALARALFAPFGDAPRRRALVAERMARRLGAPPAPEPPPLPISVVVCTHGRPHYLPTALDALARLDPAPLEVIVVDNAPGEVDCRDQVEAHGFVYVREDRKGLDNARNAGLAVARGDVVAFTDDDCVVPEGWLRHAHEPFADPFVGLVTGPAFPYRLDTPARVRMEAQASLSRGLERRVFDWTLLQPMHAGRVGAGANMLLRRSIVAGIREPFPPELDAGTLTESGGDTYMFARLLTAGHRAVYDPRVFVFHQHRSDWDAVDRAVRGYGIGMSALCMKLLVHHRELEAPRLAWWLVKQYYETQRRRLTRRLDATERQVSAAYLRGGLYGVRAWRRELARQRAIDPQMRPARDLPAPTAAPVAAPPAPVAAATGRLRFSAIIPTAGRPEALARCLQGLSRQTYPADALEVIVCDDSPDGGAAIEPAPAGPLRLRVVRTGGQGAGIARNEGAAVATGDLLLFLDDDLVPEPGLLAAHAARHERAAVPQAVIGCSPPRPPRATMASLGAALWWDDQLAALSGAAGLTFLQMLSGNVSLPREVFLDGLRFDPMFARLRREDWEWGIRLLGAGLPVVYEPAAVAAHEYRLTAGARIRACRLEGRGDQQILQRHPQAAPYLPLANHVAPGRTEIARRVALAVLGDPRADRITFPLLDALEALHLREWWMRLYSRCQRAAYLRGLRDGGWTPGDHARMPVLDVDLRSDEPIPPPQVYAPRLRLHVDGRRVSSVLAEDGHWGLRLARHMADNVNARAAAEPGASAPAADDAPRAVVVRPDAPARSFWAAALGEARATGAEAVAIPLPGRDPAGDWPAEAAVALAGPDVDLVIGRGLPADWPAEPLHLHRRTSGRLPHTPLGGAVDYVVVRARALDVLEQVVRVAPYGDQAVVLDCVDRVLGRGGLVGYRNVRGLLDASTPDAYARHGRRLEQAKFRGWGSLLYEAARRRGQLRGTAWLVGVTGGGYVRGVLRRRRGHDAELAAAEVTSALLRGYATARRAQEEPA